MPVRKKDGPRTFYIVCRDPATVAYHEPKNAISTQDGARARAASLAKETGHRFYVLKAIASCEPSAPPVEWTSL